MGIGASIILFAAGAILTWAVEVRSEGVNWDMVGVILMIVGAVAFVLSLMFWSPWAGRGTERDAHAHDPHGHSHAA